MDGSPVAWWEVGLIAFLGLWSIACVCYTFRVPRVYVWLNRKSRFGIFASWALATTPDINSNPGAHSLEYCDDGRGHSDAGWTPVLCSDYWVWHAFLWFPGKVAAFRLQCIGREIAIFSELRPPATRLIEEHGSRLKRFVEQRHPLAPNAIRQVRLLKRIVVDGREVQQIAWESKGGGHTHAP
jgi:hypothetical protein